MKTREDKGGGSVLAVRRSCEKTKDYGIVKVAEKGDVTKVESIIEKPDPDKAPSTLAVIGRYIS